MELEALRVVVKVAELGSFTHAATQLGMSKSRVSQLVLELEAELGVLLFQRTTRVVRPTPDGDQLVLRSRKLVADADEIGALFQGPRNLKGRVRVDVPTMFARTVVLPRLPELLALHPLLEMEVSATDRRVDVRREGIDCAMRIGVLADESLVAQRLGVLPMVNVVSPGYAVKYGIPMSCDDLERHFIVHYSATFGGAPAFEVEVDGLVEERPMRSLVTVNNIDAYRAACLAGLGIVQVPRYGARELLADGTLLEVLPQCTCAPMPVALVHGHGRQVPKRVRAVMTWLASLIEPFLGS